MNSTATVMVMDDCWRASFYEQAFREHTESLLEEGLAADRLTLYGEVLQTTGRFRQAMLRAFKDGALPDLVVLDHLVPPSNNAAAEHSSISVMRWLRDECVAREIEPPKCVLWTARYSPGLAYTFVGAGGRHALGREAGPDQLIDLLWSVLRDDAVWTHAPNPPTIDLGVQLRALLPYLEADLTVSDTVAAMRANGDAEVTPERVHEWRRTIGKKLNAHPGIDIDISGRTTSLARIALEHGHIWEPLEFRDPGPPARKSGP